MAGKVRDFDGSAQRIKETEAPGMWDGLYDEKRPFEKVTMYRNDFVSWVPDEWTLTEVNASTQTLLDSRNGILLDTPAGAESDGTQMQLGGTGDGETTGEAWAPAAGKNLWFECRFAAVTDADQTEFFVGLHNEDTTVIAGVGTDYIGFWVDDEDGVIDSLSAASSVVTKSSGLHTMADGIYVKVGFKVTSTDKIEFYVNDVLKATHTTSIPTALMKLTLAYLSGEASANTVGWDYVVVAQDR